MNIDVDIDHEKEQESDVKVKIIKEDDIEIINDEYIDESGNKKLRRLSVVKEDFFKEIK